MEHVGGDARENDDQGHEQLEERGEQQAVAGRLQVGAQGPLRNVLVTAPVVEVHDPHAPDEDGKARQVGIIGVGLVEDHVEVVGRPLGQDFKAADHAARVELVGDEAHGEVRRGQAAQNEEEHLDHVGVADHLHAAQRDENGEYGQGNHAHPEVDARNGGYGQGAQEKNGGQVHDHVEQQPEDGHDHTHRFVVALGEELGHGVYLVLQVNGNEKHRHDDQGKGRHPFVGREWPGPS
jgi:hypothetical protein